MKNLIKSIIKWIAVDGLLHFLVCYALMLTFTPIVGIWWTLLTTTLIALAKEAYDFFIDKDNDMQAVIHDIILDASGILMALIILLVWQLF